MTRRPGLPTDWEQLRRRHAQGEAFTYEFFWGHAPRADGAASRACLSQWFEASFELDGVRYATAEHWMMAEKARLFRDDATLARVIAAKTPGAAKAMGREVAGFDESRWNAARFAIVVRGNFAKFSAHPELAAWLLRTGDKVLVEASPQDAIWGIGLAADDPAARDPLRWRGPNLLGFAIMEARTLLAGM
jgi:ribA/ribD-fused uncharacterized protein